MKLLGQAMLFLGLLAGVGLTLFFFASDPEQRTTVLYIALAVDYAAILFGAGVSIWYFTRKDLYPELLLESHKATAVLEDGGVKLAILGAMPALRRGEQMELKALVENATTGAREVTIHLRQLSRIALKQTGNLDFPNKTTFRLEDGEVMRVSMPLSVSNDASTGRYMIEAEISAKVITKGRRARQRQGHTGSPLVRRLIQLLSLLHFSQMSLYYVFKVEADPSDAHSYVPPQAMPPGTVRTERIWAPGEEEAQLGLVYKPPKDRNMRIAAVAFIMALMTVGYIYFGIKDAIVAYTYDSVPAIIEKVEDVDDFGVVEKPSSKSHLKVTYSYEVNGSVYHNEESFYSYLDEFPMVYYNPSQPSIASLDKPRPLAAFVWAAVFLISTVFIWRKWLR